MTEGTQTLAAQVEILWKIVSLASIIFHEHTHQDSQEKKNAFTQLMQTKPVPATEIEATRTRSNSRSYLIDHVEVSFGLRCFLKPKLHSKPYWPGSNSVMVWQRNCADPSVALILIHLHLEPALPWSRSHAHEEISRSIIMIFEFNILWFARPAEFIMY